MTNGPDAAPDKPGVVVSPLILDAGDELLFFRTAAHLQAYVEAIDVVNGEYGPCWDAEGRLLKLTTEEAAIRRCSAWRTTDRWCSCRLPMDTRHHLAELHLALLRHLAAVGLEAEMPVTNDTSDLLEFAIEHAGWS